MTANRTFAIGAMVIALAGCASGPDDIASTTAALKCEEIICGGNALLAVYELDSSGATRSNGAKLLKYEAADGTELRVTVKGDRLFARTLAGNTLGGDELLNSVMTIDVSGTPDGDGKFLLRLVKVSSDPAKFWVAPAAITTYRFVVMNENDPTTGWVDFCNVPVDDPSLSGHALVYHGDRYDADKKRVYDSSAPGDPWFNIICIGTAASKLHLLRHTQAGSTTTHKTALTDRTAMLKLLAADYCGTGRSFTVTGQPLQYKDRFGWYPAIEPSFHDPTKIKMEAYFTENGATCLTEPRRIREEPWIKRDIDDECRAHGRPVLTACEPPMVPGTPRYTSGTLVR
jgi:hypothetical protein